MSRRMQNSGVAWIGELPQGWNIARIKTIYSERTELSDDGSEDLLSVSEYYGVAPRSSMVGGDFISRSESLVGYKKCYKGDFVSNIMLAWKGSFGTTQYDGIVSPAYCVYIPSPSICPKYYHYLFRTDLYKTRFHLFSRGIIDSRLRLYSPFFFDVEAIIPPLAEQKAIADFLDKKCNEIDELVSLQEKMIEELKAYKQSVITEAVCKGLNPNVPMKDSGVDWIGEIPKGWQSVPFRAIYNLTKGLNITKENLVENGVPVISYGQIHSKENSGTCIKESLLRYVPETYLIESPTCLVKKGDIIFADTSEDLEGCGNGVYIDKHMQLFAGYHTIIAQVQDIRGITKYLSYLFLTGAWRLQIRSMVNGVKLYSIPQKLLKRTTIILPPIAEQEEIADYLDKKCSEIDQLISIKQQKIVELKDYKKSLIYEYTTGKNSL